MCPLAQGILFDFEGVGSTNRLSQGLVVAWDSEIPIAGIWSPVPATWPSTRRPGWFHPCLVLKFTSSA